MSCLTFPLNYRREKYHQHQKPKQSSKLPVLFLGRNRTQGNGRALPCHKLARGKQEFCVLRRCHKDSLIFNHILIQSKIQLVLLRSHLPWQTHRQAWRPKLSQLLQFKEWALCSWNCHVAATAMSMQIQGSVQNKVI